MEKIENFLMTGFGKVLTLIHVEKNALFCKYKPGENATNDFFHALLYMGIGKLCLYLLQVKHSAPSELHAFSLSAVLLNPYLCAREAVSYPQSSHALTAW